MEKIYTINLREAYEKPRKKRAPRAINLIKEFVKRHTKAEEAKVSVMLNAFIWARSIAKPPRKVKVKVVKEDNIAYVYAFDEEIKPFKPKKEEKEKKEEKKKEEEEKQEKKEEKAEKQEKTKPKKEEKKEEKQEKEENQAQKDHENNKAEKKQKVKQAKEKKEKSKA